MCRSVNRSSAFVGRRGLAALPPQLATDAAAEGSAVVGMLVANVRQPPRTDLDPRTGAELLARQLPAADVGVDRGATGHELVLIVVGAFHAGLQRVDAVEVQIDRVSAADDGLAGEQ